MSALDGRLRARGVDPAAFRVWAQPAAWAQAAGYRASLERLDDRELDGLIATYRQTVGSPTRRPPASHMTPEQAHRMVEEGAQRHRDRLALEQVARQVISRAAQRARSQHPFCGRCTPLVPCHQHGG
jgi:uncharacterized protein YjiS (DUF1127 family)